MVGDRSSTRAPQRQGLSPSAARAVRSAYICPASSPIITPTEKEGKTGFDAFFACAACAHMSTYHSYASSRAWAPTRLRLLSTGVLPATAQMCGCTGGCRVVLPKRTDPTCLHRPVSSRCAGPRRVCPPLYGATRLRKRIILCKIPGYSTGPATTPPLRSPACPMLGMESLKALGSFLRKGTPGAAG